MLRESSLLLGHQSARHPGRCTLLVLVHGSGRTLRSCHSLNRHLLRAGSLLHAAISVLHGSAVRTVIAEALDRRLLRGLCPPVSRGSVGLQLGRPANLLAARWLYRRNGARISQSRCRVAKNELEVAVRVHSSEFCELCGRRWAWPIANVILSRLLL